MGSEQDHYEWPIRLASARSITGWPPFVHILAVAGVELFV